MQQFYVTLKGQFRNQIKKTPMSLTPKQHKDLRQLNRLLSKWIRIAQKNDIKLIDSTWQKKYTEFVQLFISTRNTLEIVKNTPEKVSVTPMVKETPKTEPAPTVKKDEPAPKKEELKKEEPEQEKPVAPVTSIKRSVGKKGTNRKSDVKLIQELLNQKGANLGVDGMCGNKTIKAIHKFQQKYAGYKYGDGRIDPGGQSWKALTDGSVAIPQEEPMVKETPKKETPVSVKKEDKTTLIAKDKEPVVIKPIAPETAKKPQPETVGSGYEFPKPNIPKVDIVKPHNEVIKKEEPTTNLTDKDKQLLLSLKQRTDEVAGHFLQEIEGQTDKSSRNLIIEQLQAEFSLILEEGQKEELSKEGEQELVSYQHQKLEGLNSNATQKDRKDEQKLFDVYSKKIDGSDYNKLIQVCSTLRTNIGSTSDSLSKKINDWALANAEIADAKNIAYDNEFEPARAAQTALDKANSSSILGDILGIIATFVIPGAGIIKGLANAFGKSKEIVEKIGNVVDLISDIGGNAASLALEAINSSDGDSSIDKNTAFKDKNKAEIAIRKMLAVIFDKLGAYKAGLDKLEKYLINNKEILEANGFDKIKNQFISLIETWETVQKNVQATDFFVKAPNISGGRKAEIALQLERSLWVSWIPANLSESDDYKEDYMDIIKEAQKKVQAMKTVGDFGDFFDKKTLERLEKSTIEEAKKEALKKLQDEMEDRNGDGEGTKLDIHADVKKRLKATGVTKTAGVSLDYDYKKIKMDAMRYSFNLSGSSQKLIEIDRQVAKLITWAIKEQDKIKNQSVWKQALGL